MGQIRIKVKGKIEINPPTVDGDIGDVAFNEGSCNTTVALTVKANCWVKLIASSANVIVSCSTNPGFDFDGEQISVDHDFIVIIYGYSSQTQSQNVLTSNCDVTSSVSDGGAVLDRTKIIRYHTGSLC